MSIAMHEPEYDELAEYFDVFNEKYVPYQKQCDFIEEAVAEYGKSARRILDLACGTGNHSIRLAERGYEVVGVDLSDKLLAIARDKAATAALEVDFRHGDMRDLSFDADFDVAICLNYPVAHCASHTDLARFFRGVRDSLKPGGIFIFDFLSHYGRDSSTTKEWVETEDVRIECICEWSHDRERQVQGEKLTYFVTIRGTISRCEGYTEWQLFYPQEMVFYLQGMAGFKVLGLHERWSLKDRPEGPGWAVVAERPGSA